jgi:LDH2 family malate/lactate/ureidoglycolate dehydrogenase
MADRMLISADDLKELVVSILVRHQVPTASAALQAELLVAADACGQPSHGVMRLPRIVRRIVNRVTDPAATGDHMWTGTATLAVDGRQGLGPVVATRALDAIMERSRSTGISTALLRNTNHLGMLGWYVAAAARSGHVALVFCTSEALVHPWGGRDALLGTNPIAIGVPARPDPLVLDMATSQVSMGKIHDFAGRGVPLEPGWALDSAGEPTTSARLATTGAISPFGGAKGYALGLALEVLVATLTQTALGTTVKGTLDDTEPSSKGDIMIVFGPEPVGANDATSAYLDTIRDARPSDPRAPVSVPGDGARRRREASTRVGITLAEPTWLALRTIAEPRTNQRWHE